MIVRQTYSMNCQHKIQFCWVSNLFFYTQSTVISGWATLKRGEEWRGVGGNQHQQHWCWSTNWLPNSRQSSIKVLVSVLTEQWYKACKWMYLHIFYAFAQHREETVDIWNNPVHTVAVRSTTQPHTELTSCSSNTISHCCPPTEMNIITQTGPQAQKN